MLLIPRLDFKDLAARAAGGGSGRAAPFGRGPVVRPPARPFVSGEAQALGLNVMRDRYESSVLVINTHRWVLV